MMGYTDSSPGIDDCIDRRMYRQRKEDLLRLGVRLQTEATPKVGIQGARSNRIGQFTPSKVRLLRRSENIFFVWGGDCMKMRKLVLLSMPKGRGF